MLMLFEIPIFLNKKIETLKLNSKGVASFLRKNGTRFLDKNTKTLELEQVITMFFGYKQSDERKLFVKCYKKLTVLVYTDVF